LCTALNLRVPEQSECTVRITFRQVADQVSWRLISVSLEVKIEVPGRWRGANGPGGNRGVGVDVRGQAIAFSLEARSCHCKADAEEWISNIH
jgi:hypothetical protein